MVKVILHGCGGHMGRMVTEMCKQDSNMEIVAGIDISREAADDFLVFSNIHACNVPADVMIDFSNASAVDTMLDYCVERKLPVVICTTGFNEHQLKHIEEASDKVAILRSANMSMGINLIHKLLKVITPVLAEAGFDIEIIEKHHNQKVDAPSGTALALADTMNEAMDNTYKYVYDRSLSSQKRNPKEIGISSVRGGTIVGDHDVIFAGTDEIITMSHRAYSKAVFAKGAIWAAKFLADISSEPDHNIGLYTMSDIIEDN